uniref:Gamma-secretase subunit PEN-2 n=1 Tax=Acrobeloides nanus TaxID=290746 RepID=A0A914DE77_9BILA
MDLENLNGAEKLLLCKKYFHLGLACLPLVWIVNFIWFFKYAFKVENFPQQDEIKKYVIGSAIGSIFWILILSIWVTVFQIFRIESPEIMDYITFVFPIGYK